MTKKLLACRQCGTHTVFTKTVSGEWVDWARHELPANQVVDFSEEIETLATLQAKIRFIPAHERQARKEQQS